MGKRGRAGTEEQVQQNVEHNVLDKIDLAVLGQRLRAAREAANITSRDAARHINAVSSYINNVEEGRIRIGAGELLELAHRYGTQAAFLIRGPLPYTSDDEAIQACINCEISEGALAHFLGVDRLEARRRTQEYETRHV